MQRASSADPVKDGTRFVGAPLIPFAGITLPPWLDKPSVEIPIPEAIVEAFGLSFDVIPIHGFGVLVAVGFLVGGHLSMKRARRIGLDADAVNRLIGWLVVGTFIGGHVGYGLMYKFDEYMADPSLFLRVWDGLSSYGGFVVCIPLAYFFFKWNKLPIWPYMDTIGYGLAFGFGIGRLGCFVAHDHPGNPTDFFLAFNGICFDASPACHDLGLYEALWCFAIGIVFIIMDRAPRVPGFYPLLLGTLYAPGRFILDFFRPLQNDPRNLGLTPAQWWSIALLLFCGGLLIQRLRSGDEPVWTPPGTKPPEKPEEPETEK